MGRLCAFSFRLSFQVPCRALPSLPAPTEPLPRRPACRLALSLPYRMLCRACQVALLPALICRAGRHAMDPPLYLLYLRSYFRDCTVIAMASKEHPVRRRQQERRVGRASRGRVRREGRFLPVCAPGVSWSARGRLRAATPPGQPWTPAMPRPQGRHGRRAPSLCRPLHRACRRRVWRAVPPVRPAMACHHSHHREGDRRGRRGDGTGPAGSVTAGAPGDQTRELRRSPSTARRGVSRTEAPFAKQKYCFFA